MQQKRLVELCQWDFVSYSDAVATSPYGTDVIRYTKMREPLKIYDPSSRPTDIIEIQQYEIRVGTEPFGFYSWMPTCPSDRAIILAHKTKPKPWTTYKPENEEETNSICSIVERLIGHRGLLAGVSCIGEQLFAKEFLIMLAQAFSNPAPIFANFSVSEQEMFRCQSQEMLVEYLQCLLGRCATLNVTSSQR